MMMDIKEEVIRLTKALVQIPSCNPSLDVNGRGEGEGKIAEFVADWLSARGFHVQTVQSATGRPSVIGTARGTGGKGAKTMMFNGHLDTVSVQNYTLDPFSGLVHDGKLYGRGSADMKGGLAAAMVAAASALEKNKLVGTVIVAAVADEEMASEGSLSVLQQNLSIDAAIFPEPTQEAIVTCHRGFVWIEIQAHGKAAHGSKYDEGRDAIVMMGRLICKIGRLSEKLRAKQADPLLGHGSIHCGTIHGGVETSTYPSACTLTVERRTLPDEDTTSVLHEINGLIAECARETNDDVHLTTKLLFDRPPLQTNEAQRAFADRVEKSARRSLGARVKQVGGTFWTDAALFGCPSIVFGPSGHGIHEEEEYVEVDSLQAITQAYFDICIDVCGN